MTGVQVTTEAANPMPRQIHPSDVVHHWRVGSVEMTGAVASHSPVEDEPRARLLASQLSEFPEVRETWIRPVFHGGYIGQPTAYFRDGRQVAS